MCVLQWNIWIAPPQMDRSLPYVSRSTVSRLVVYYMAHIYASSHPVSTGYTSSKLLRDLPNRVASVPANGFIALQMPQCAAPAAGPSPGDWATDEVGRVKIQGAALKRPWQTMGSKSRTWLWNPQKYWSLLESDGSWPYNFLLINSATVSTAFLNEKVTGTGKLATHSPSSPAAAF